MKLVLIVFVILSSISVYFALTGNEYLWPPTPMLANVYTMTPRFQGSTLSNVAQMWWQPVSYIRNPYMSSTIGSYLDGNMSS